MNIAIIGAGNVGGLLAGRIIDADLADVTLVDIKETLARAKAADISDSLYLSKSSRHIEASSNFAQLQNSSPLVITAGFPRKPGMTREDLISKNAQLIKDIASQIKPFLKDKIVIIVTNPLDLMTYYFKKLTNIDSKRLIGMGSSLDAARFAHLIASKLGVTTKDIESYVIASHGQEMLPLARLTSVKGKSLEQVISSQELKSLKEKTLERGAEIVALYESGSAYFAPSAAAFQLTQAIVKDEKKIICACAYLNGEYGLNDICLGVPLKVGKAGIEEIIDLKLNPQEKTEFHKAAESFRQSIKQLEPH